MAGYSELDIAMIERKRHRPIYYKRQCFANIWAMAKYFEIPSSVALARLELGWVSEEIIDKPHQKEKMHAYWKNRYIEGIEPANA